MSPVSPPSIRALAWRQTLRDFRAGELRLLALAVMLAVAALTAVGFFADRLSNGLERNARQLLGGDAVVRSDQPAPPELQDRAREIGLRVAHSVSFPSMARAPDELGGATRLVAVKAVGETYPLRGQLQLRSEPKPRKPHTLNIITCFAAWSPHRLGARGGLQRQGLAQPLDHQPVQREPATNVSSGNL